MCDDCRRLPTIWQLPRCTVVSLARATRSLLTCDAPRLRTWAHDEDGMAYVCVYLAAALCALHALPSH